MILLVSILFGGILLDQWTKYLAQTGVLSFDVIKGIIGFRYAENTGAAFSLFRDYTYLLIVVASLSTILAIIIYFKSSNNLIFKLGIALIIAGGLGNLIDRIRLGYVVDFIQLQFINFPIFNIADILITIGVVLVMYAYLFLKVEI